MEHLLMLLGVPEDRFGSGEVGATTDVLRAYEILADHGALVIGAHVNSTHGIAMQGLRFGGQTKIAYTQDPHLHALEVTDLLPATNRRSTARFFSGTKSEYPRRMHCIQGSDAHRLEQDPARETNLGIGDRPTEVLLPEMSFAALKALLTSDEFDRVRAFTAPPSDPVKAARLEGNTAHQAFHESAGSKRGQSAILRDVVAFANSGGGRVYLGVSASEKRAIAGLADAKTVVDELSRDIASQIITRRGDVRGAGLRRQTGRHPARGRGGAQTACRRPRRHLRPPRCRVSPGDARRDRPDGHRRRGRGAGDDHPVAGRTNARSVERPRSWRAGHEGRRGAGAQTAARDSRPGETRGSRRDRSVTRGSLRSQRFRLGQIGAAGGIAPGRSPEIYEEPSGADPVAPTTGIEVLDLYEQDGIRYYTLRDLRYHKLIHNVTRSTDRRPGAPRSPSVRKATSTKRPCAGRATTVFWRSYRQRSGDRRYDLVYRGDGDPRIFFGVSESVWTTAGRRSCPPPRSPPDDARRARPG